MKPIHAVIALAFLAPAPALAVEKASSQQEKLSHCAHESKDRGLKGEERQKFMSECLKRHDKPAAREARHEAAHHGGQQGRMKSCNDEARRKDLHGDERRAFMSTCLKG